MTSLLWHYCVQQTCEPCALRALLITGLRPQPCGISDEYINFRTNGHCNAYSTSYSNNINTIQCRDRIVDRRRGGRAGGRGDGCGRRGVGCLPRDWRRRFRSPDRRTRVRTPLLSHLRSARTSCSQPPVLHAPDQLRALGASARAPASLTLRCVHFSTMLFFAIWTCPDKVHFWAIRVRLLRKSAQCVFNH